MFVPLLFGLLVFLGVVGNGMVILVILLRRKMRTTVNLLLLNLACSDLLFVLLCIPFQIYHFAADNWLIGDVACKLFQFMIYVTMYVTVYTLVMIALLRFCTIVCTSNTIRLRTKRNVCMLIGSLWGVMMVSNINILLNYRVKTFPIVSQEPPYHYCGMENTEVGRKIFVSFFILTYIVPVSIICTFYILILRYLHRNRSASLRLSTRSTNSMSRERSSHVTRILIVVVIVFALCWLPLHLHLLVAYFLSPEFNQTQQVFRVIFHFLAYSNSCTNPFIYNYVSKDFRRSFRELWLCRRDEPVQQFENEMLTAVNGSKNVSNAIALNDNQSNGNTVEG